LKKEGGRTKREASAKSGGDKKKAEGPLLSRRGRGEGKGTKRTEGSDNQGWKKSDARNLEVKQRWPSPLVDEILEESLTDRSQ